MNEPKSKNMKTFFIKFHSPHFLKTLVIFHFSVSISNFPIFDGNTVDIIKGRNFLNLIDAIIMEFHKIVFIDLKWFNGICQMRFQFSREIKCNVLSVV